MIVLLRTDGLYALFEKLEHIGEPVTERIPIINTDGRVIVSHHFHFRWGLTDIYVGIPEDSCLLSGPENDIQRLLPLLGVPTKTFNQAIAVA